MDAPKSRYSVVEKDGRLVVIDNATGAPASPAPPRPGAGRPGPAPVPVEAGKGTLDSLADALLTLAVREWDGDGRAVIAWEWKEGGSIRRWDARLDAGQQRRLGRALLGFAGIPAFVLLFILGEGALLWLGALLAIAPAMWSVGVIRRLRRETEDQVPPDGRAGAK